jgi:hypothetical protein
MCPRFTGSNASGLVLINVLVLLNLRMVGNPEVISSCLLETAHTCRGDPYSGRGTKAVDKPHEESSQAPAESGIREC